MRLQAKAGYAHSDMWRWLFEALINLLLTILVARTKSLGLQVEPLEHVRPEAPATRRAHQRERGNDFVEPKARLHTGASYLVLEYSSPWEKLREYM